MVKPKFFFCFFNMTFYPTGLELMSPNPADSDQDRTGPGQPYMNRLYREGVLSTLVYDL